MDCDTITKRTVADLVVVLQKIDERQGRQAARCLAAISIVLVWGGLALVGEARGEYPGDVTPRIRSVILIVALLLCGQQAVPSMVIVVVPLCAVFALRWIAERIEQARTVVVILQDEVDQPSSRGSEVPDRAAEVMQDRWLPCFHDGVNRVEAKAVESIASEPMQRIADRKGANLRDAIIDSVSPRRVSAGEECRRVAMEVVAFGAEMVVDDVEKNHQPPRIRFVHY